MSLTNAGAIATKSLGTISNQINVVSRNIAGAGLPGVNAKTSLIATGFNGAADFLGVGRLADTALFRNLLSASAGQGSAAALSDALDQIDRALNLSDPVRSRSPASSISRLTSALQTLSASPDNETAAQLALASAQEVVASLHDATTVTQTLRREADDAIADAVANVNDALLTFETVNREIVARTASGADISDLLDQRDQLLTQLSSQIGVTTVTRPDNDMVIYTDSGVTLFETTPRNVSFQQTPTLSPGVSGAAVYIDGVQVTGGAGSTLALRGGAIYGLTQLRDVVAPQYQSQLDEIARGLVVAFAETDQSGGGPPMPGLVTYAGAIGVPGPTVIPGLAGQIEINASVDPAQGGEISRLRDGGLSGDPAYVYNPGGASGYADRLLQLVNAASAPQSFDPAAGLGADGSLNAIAAGSNCWVGAQRQ